MEPIILSERSVFLLSQLSNLVYRRSSERFRLTEETSIRDLLNYSSRLHDQNVAECHEAFMESLNPYELQQLIRANAQVGKPAVLEATA